jgi:AcrR family transcriptional regulator
MLAAMVETCAELGVTKVTVADVVSRSGVSRRTFYEVFTDRDDCFLAALEDSIACAGRYVLRVYETPGTWQERMREGLQAFLRFLDDDPGRARLLIVDTLAGGPIALGRRHQILTAVTAAIDEGRLEGPALKRPGSLNEPNRGSFEALAGELMGMIVLPYLGAAAAAHELARRPSRRRLRRPPSANPFRQLDMRLTYRTVRVLVAVAKQLGDRRPVETLTRVRRRAKTVKGVDN